MSKYDFDLFTIGAGSGGVRASRLAANFGAKVAIAEEYKYGGTCVIRGCVPKKLMVYAAQYQHELTRATSFGWQFKDAHHDWNILCTNRNSEVERLSKIYQNLLVNSNINIYNDKAIIIDEHNIKLVKQDKIISTKKILIATGGQPFVDKSVQGYEFGITSNEIFTLKQRPKNIIIYGGGYIACEFASIFAGLGSKVTLIYRGEKILKSFDNELVEQLLQILQYNNISIKTNSTVKSIDNNGKQVTLTNGETIYTDKFIWATGRKPYIKGLGLEKVNIDISKNKILVNKQYQTTVKSIFAIGDVTDKINLTPVAIREATTFANQQFNPNYDQADDFCHENIPCAVFTIPQISTIGLTEQDCLNKNIKAKIYTTCFASMHEAFLEDKEKVFFKLIVDTQTNIIIGAHILAPEAGELIQLIAIAIKAQLTKDDFDKTCAVHPTISEELVTMSSPKRVI